MQFKVMFPDRLLVSVREDIEPIESFVIQRGPASLESRRRCGHESRARYDRSRLRYAMALDKFII